MAMNLAALKAKLAAQSTSVTTEVHNVQTVSPEVPKTSTDVAVLVTGSTGNQSNVQVEPVPADVPTVSVPSVLGTAKTTEIDHLDFLNKMNSLATAIHSQHPTMPVLLMQIHKQLRADPELVTTLDEDAIGIIVKGLQVQTKTELVSVKLKEPASRKKKIALSADMF